VLHFLLEKLRSDECLILPSDTIYGLAGRAYSSLVLSKVYEIKNRPLDKKLPVHYCSIDQLSIDFEIPDLLIELADKYWPGALSVILNKKPDSKLAIDSPNIAVRIPNHPFLLSIIEALNEPIIMTSANLSGQKPKNTFAEIAKELNLDGFCDDESVLGVESTIIDISTKEIKLVRSGALVLSI
jgi:L-threonylcarbamoyladenylate synthase